MSKYVYVVASGVYSDYSIDTIMSTEEAAQEVVRRMDPQGRHYDEPRYEVWEVFDSPDDVLVGEQWVGWARWNDGVWHLHVEQELHRAFTEPFEEEPSYEYYRYTGVHAIYCSGHSEEQVRKALSDYIVANHDLLMSKVSGA